MPRVLRYVLVVSGAIASILLFLLASASASASLFDRYYSWLLGLNVLITASLLVMVVVSLARLYARHKSGKFGSRLMARLVLLFGAIGILPGLVIFLVSVQFVSNSIDSWFNVPIDRALKSGLELGISALDDKLLELKAAANEMAPQFADQPAFAMTGNLARLVRKRQGLQNAIVVDAVGRVVASSSAGAELSADLPTADMMSEARTLSGYAKSETGADRDPREAGTAGADAGGARDGVSGLRSRVLVGIPDSAVGAQGAPPRRFLQLLELVPANLAEDAEALQLAYREYKERAVGRVGLRKMYIITLVLTLLLAIFGAVASAFVIAENLAKPLLVLAEGTRAVAEGDLSPRPIVATSDELGTLTQSFNTMTHQLSDARGAVERNRVALQNAKAHLESVLENMSAGVIVLGADFNLITCNEAADRILQAPVSRRMGQRLAEIDDLGVFAAAVTRAFSAQSAQSAAGDVARTHWHQELEIPRRVGDESDISLLARGSRLPLVNGGGYIVVFDDITDVISAQRSIAWGEVARRLAHEIKNPLTPIQLSAERLQMKLGGKLNAADAALLDRGTATIVSQVAAMKRMVDDFRDYARTPPAVLEALDLNVLVEEILHLYLRGDASDVIHAVLAAGLPQVMGDATQLRQVIHNLLQNAQDALAERASGVAARIDLRTEAIAYRHADGNDAQAVRLTITDNGPGFAPKILARAFEPYVTSKTRGTGLGLPMVKKIVDEHGGKITLENRVDETGGAVSILLLKLKLRPGAEAAAGQDQFF